jgi:hypothetical protein
MPNLKYKAISLLGSKTSVNMQAAASTTIFTTSDVCRIAYVVVRDISATLAGGTSYSFTNFRQTVDLSSLTTANTDYIVLDGNNVKYTETAANTAFQITVTTGSTGAATATVDVFGYYA